MENKLQEWTAPRLMRLNQADGTDKHLDITEDVFTTQTVPTWANCTGSDNGTGGVVAAGAVCGPS